MLKCKITNEVENWPFLKNRENRIIIFVLFRVLGANDLFFNLTIPSRLFNSQQVNLLIWKMAKDWIRTMDLWFLEKWLKTGFEPWTSGF